MVIQRDAEQLHLPPEKAFGVKGRRSGEAAKNRLGHFPFRADHDVDGQMIAAEQIGMDRIKVGLRPEPGDLGYG